MGRINGTVIGTAVVLVVMLVGCSAGVAPAASTGADQGAASNRSSGAPAAAAEYISVAFPASYDDALLASTQLALGILRLEDTPQAVTAAEAKTLLPLWQAFQGNALQSDAERNAVLKQIEGALSADQVKAIAGMKLTNDDMRKWAEQNGMRFLPSGTPGPGAPGGNLTDAQRQAFRATAEAGGGPGAGAFNNLTDAQRQAFRATVEAGGGQLRQGGQAPGARGTPGPDGNGARFFRDAAPYRIFVNPLVQLLTQRTAE